MKKLNRWTKWLYFTGNRELAFTLIIFGVVLLIMSWTNCGGSGSSPPVYSDNGVCLANCPDINSPDNGKDGFKTDLADSQSGDQTQSDGSTDEETTAYVCPNPENPPEMCKTDAIKETEKSGCYCKAYTSGPDCPRACGGGFNSGKPCTTPAECQQIPIIYGSLANDAKKAKEGKCIDLPDNHYYVCEPGFYPESGEDCNECGGHDCIDWFDSYHAIFYQCKGGLYNGFPCDPTWGEEYCRRTLWPPCVCWEFCGYAEAWQTPYEVAGHGLVTVDLRSLKDNGDSCLVGTKYIGKPGKPTLLSLDGTTELSFGPYCVRETEPVLMKAIGSCSNTANTNSCLEANSCWGKCNVGYYAGCACDGDCHYLAEWITCGSMNCSLTKEECHRSSCSDPDPCPQVFAPCQAMDNEHLIEKSCSSDGMCDETVWVKCPPEASYEYNCI